jgi:hypothetical protein
LKNDFITEVIGNVDLVTDSINSTALYKKFKKSKYLDIFELLY